MIAGKDTHPEKELYYIGSIILKVISNSVSKEIDYFETYHLVSKQHKISINLFNLAFDWLFLVGAVKPNNGSIEKCF